LMPLLNTSRMLIWTTKSDEDYVYFTPFYISKLSF
jgi:hypothetical protein